MSIDEPTAIGTVVRDDVGKLWVRSESGRKGGAVWLADDDTAWETRWEAIGNAVVVHEGYVPPTPEPTGVLAVIRDAEGRLRWRRDRNGYFSWERADGCGSLPWGLMPQPVEVLFEGVDE